MIDQMSTDNRTTRVDLSRLHIEMDHVARSYWDVQKTRISIHNRVAGLERMAGPLGGILLDVGNLANLEASLKREEDRLNRDLERLARQHPLAEWVERTRGIGLPGFARLMGLTGPLDRFGNPAKLWKFVGLGLVDGRTQKRRKGEPWTHTDCKHGHLQKCKPGCTTDHHPNCQPDAEGNAYSPQGRVICFQIVDSIVKLGGPYRAVYDETKAKYEARERSGPSECPTGLHHRTESGKTTRCPQAHVDMLARRYTAKRLVRDMWIEWHHSRFATHTSHVSL